MQEDLIQLTLESAIPHIPIYTIGYGGRTIEQFLKLLSEYDINFLIDIRSQPYSRVNHSFSRDAFEKILRKNRIRYVFMGDTLGGRPQDQTCYVDGRVDYSKVREKTFYQDGVSRIETAWEKQIAVALMCAEVKPQECHRSKLIGNTLCNLHIEVAHIDELGKIKTQHAVNKMLLDTQIPLFSEGQSSLLLNDKINFSRKKYMLPGEKKS
jgi:uncharacterized protein (DUF488 family)